MVYEPELTPRICLSDLLLRVMPTPVPPTPDGGRLSRSFGQQPKHWSGWLKAICESVRVSVAGEAVKRPPPWRVTP